MGVLFVVHHAKHAGNALAFPADARCLRWETCLRQIAVSTKALPEQSLDAGWESYSGDAAYRFLLEVITGLHSPVIGETEVLGQFRAAIETQLANPKLSAGARSQLQKLSQRLYKDAKSIREVFFTGVGSQSYGSIARRLSRDCDSLLVLGAGQLAEEILPWLDNGKRSLQLFCRDTRRAARLQTKHGGLGVHALSAFAASARQAPGRKAVLVAAPLESGALAAMLAENFSAADLLLDFRADSSAARLGFAGAALSLDDIFRDLENSNQLLCERAEAAKLAILQMAAKHSERVEHKPFGWDDVCA